jgi:CheY-like chemotaxis protein
MAKQRAFLIHWKKEELSPKAQLLRSLGFTVTTEHEDGGRAGKAIMEKPPDVIVIYLSRLPSHGAETAAYVAQAKPTRHIPIVFVDGEPEKVTKVKKKVPSGIFTTEERFAATIKKIFEG